MPEPFARPEALEPDDVVAILSKGARARQVLQLGVSDDLQRRRRAIWAIAERELRGGLLTMERAFMHVACSNALNRYDEELKDDIRTAERAAKSLHEADAAEAEDGESSLPEGE